MILKNKKLAVIMGIIIYIASLIAMYYYLKWNLVVDVTIKDLADSNIPSDLVTNNIERLKGIDLNRNIDFNTKTTKDNFIYKFLGLFSDNSNNYYPSYFTNGNIISNNAKPDFIPKLDTNKYLIIYYQGLINELDNIIIRIITDFSDLLNEHQGLYDLYINSRK